MLEHELNGCLGFSPMAVYLFLVQFLRRQVQLVKQEAAASSIPAAITECKAALWVLGSGTRLSGKCYDDLCRLAC